MSLNLSQNVPVDDTDSHFAYSSGDWQVLSGSTRQWEAGVHSTGTPGATVAFSFQGQAFVVYVTLPGGGGNVVADISIDGGSATRITQATGSDNAYMNVLFQSSVMEFASHSVVITNRGSSSGPSLMFDEVTLYSEDIVPSMNNPPTVSPPTIATSSTVQPPKPTPQPPGTVTVTTTTNQASIKTSSSGISTSIESSSIKNTETKSSALSPTGTASSSSTMPLTFSSTTLLETSTSTSFSTDSNGDVSTIVNVFTTSVLQSVETGSTSPSVTSHSSVPIGTIIGAVLGGLAFLVLCLIALLLCRRRRKTLDRHSRLADAETYGRSRALKPLEPEPFRVSAPPHAQNHPYPINEARPFRSNEKSALRIQQASEDTAGPSSPESSSHSNHAYGFAAASTSAATLLDHGPSAFTQPVNASVETHQRSNSATTSSSMYASPIVGTGDEVPPPYQPSITTRLLDFKSRHISS